MPEIVIPSWVFLLRNKEIVKAFRIKIKKNLGLPSAEDSNSITLVEMYYLCRKF